MVTELRTAQRLILKWFEAGIDFLMHNSGCMRAARIRLRHRSFFGSFFDKKKRTGQFYKKINVIISPSTLGLDPFF